MLKNLKQKQEGFTIIEVMIVLVIAAVILLIVFLAVPALQRNSRNTQKKNVAADIASASSEYISNNNGTLPTADSSSTTANSDAAKILALVNTNGIITNLDFRATRTGAAPTNMTDAALELNAKCATSTTGTPPVTVYSGAGTGKRQAVLLYNVEGSGGSKQTVCIETGL